MRFNWLLIIAYDKDIHVRFCTSESDDFTTTVNILNIFEFKRFKSPGAGVHIRFKCSEPINRPSKTKNFEICTNWEHMNSLGVKTLDYGVTLYKDYYDDYKADGISNSFFGRLSKCSYMRFNAVNLLSLKF